MFLASILYYERTRPGAGSPTSTRYRGLTVLFGACSFVFVLVLTKSAAATCCTGRGPMLEWCQTSLSRSLLLFSCFTSTLAAIVAGVIVVRRLDNAASQGLIPQPHLGGFFISFLTNQIVSEGMAWIFGTFYFWWEGRKEKKLVAARQYPDYTTFNVTHMLFVDFLSNYRWPQVIRGRGGGGVSHANVLPYMLGLNTLCWGLPPQDIMPPPPEGRKTEFCHDVVTQLSVPID